MKRLVIYSLLVSLLTAANPGLNEFSLARLVPDAETAALGGSTAADLGRPFAFMLNPGLHYETARPKFTVSYVKWLSDVQGFSAGGLIPVKKVNIGIVMEFMHPGRIYFTDPFGNYVTASDNSVLEFSAPHLAFDGNVSFKAGKFSAGLSSDLILKKLPTVDSSFSEVDESFQAYSTISLGTALAVNENISLGLGFRDFGLNINTPFSLDTGFRFYYKGTSLVFAGHLAIAVVREQAPRLAAGAELEVLEIVTFLLGFDQALSMDQGGLSHNISTGISLGIDRVNLCIAFTPFYRSLGHSVMVSLRLRDVPGKPDKKKKKPRKVKTRLPRKDPDTSGPGGGPGGARPGARPK